MVVMYCIIANVGDGGDGVHLMADTKTMPLRLLLLLLLPPFH